MHGRREKSPPRAARFFAETRQLPAAGNDLFRTICSLTRCPHWILLFLAKGCFAGSGFAYHLRRPPTDEYQSNQNLPTICVPVSGNRKVIAEHDEDNRHRHECVVPGPQLSLGPERRIERGAGCGRGNHLALRGQNSHPHVQHHDGSEHCPDVDVSGASAEDVYNRRRFLLS